jgi:hypothetical protein
MTNKQWRLIRAMATIGTAVVTLHGISSKRWRTWHTVLAVVGLVASIGAVVTKPTRGPEEPLVQVNL